MLKSIYHFITKSFLFETDEDKRRIIGLYIFMLAGLVYAIFDFSVAILERPAYACIPGDITLVTICAIGIYSLRQRKITYAVNSIFLVPVVIYFFYISKQHSILPTHQSIINTLWVLIGSFIFLILFDNNLKKLSIFFGWAFITLLFHVYQANRISDALSFKWPGEDMLFNPFFILILSFGIVWLIGWNFILTINSLRIKLDKNEKQVNQTVKGLQQGILLMEIVRDEMENPVGLKILKTNPAFESMFRVQARELREADAEVIFPKVFRGSFQWNSFYLQSTKKKTEIHVDHLNKWFEVFNLSPAPDQIASIFYDVTQKQKNIESLKDSRRRYKVLLEAIPDIFFIIDKDGIYMDFVIKESELVQISADDIVGNSIYEVGFSEKMSRKIFQCIQHAIQFDTIETIEYALEVEKGTAMFEMRIAKLDDNSVISIARDITKRKIAEIRLEEAKIKAEEADQLKSAFLANISHEIRTPMNAIIGFSKMIGSPDFDMEEKNRFIEIIVSNGKLLMEMINDMISLSKIESNQIVVRKDFCKINEIMLDLYREYSYDVSNKPIRLKLSNENANPKFGIVTDQAILMEVMQKLLDNAIKFTDKGEVEFGYKLVSKDQLQFFVKDTGIGIEEAQIKKIFERFHQVDNKTTRRYEGTGLGLAIAQHFVNLIEGEIGVKSELGHGSLFYFTIPFKGGESTLKIVR